MWAPTGDLIGERRSHIAVLLPNGKVLVAGGEHPGESLATAELYDPANGTWSSTGSLSVSRSNATAVLLPNGKVLVAGGVSGDYTNTAELYDPETGTWTPTDNMASARAFSNHDRAMLLPNGKVLVAGGQSSGKVSLATAELYDPVTGTWAFTGSMAAPRQDYSTTLLPNGRVLVAGGQYEVANVRIALYASAEVYDPATGTWSSAGSLGTARAYHTAPLLPNGEVLVAGGSDAVGATFASAEVFAPCNTPAGSNVTVTPEVGVSLTFSSVSAQGATSVTTSSSGPAAPAGFSFGDPPTYYDIQTTARFTGVVTVCITYDPTRYIAPLSLMHYENNAWADVTISNDTTNHVICGAASSLSPFAVAGKAYIFTGFFRPVENVPVFNALKAGSAVPVKFSLQGNQGLTIFGAGYPKSQTIACDPTAIVEGVDETVTAGASSLSYDAATDQYVYVWKTLSAWANTCRQLILKLRDGSIHRANFTFKK